MKRTDRGTSLLRRRVWMWLVVGAGAVAAGGAAAAFAQDPVELRGEAILKHPVGSLAIKAAGLMSAGKIEQAVQLGHEGGPVGMEEVSGRREGAQGRAVERAGSGPGCRIATPSARPES